MSDFASEVSKLNRDQKEAVEHIDGPLLVIAGPGTGKTQLLSLRVANILTKTDTLPENILCLTFTESGALEMHHRLINIIGEDSYKVTVSTYHSFGSEIIRQYPGYFVGNINLTPINKLKADTIIRELQKSLPFTSDLKYSQLVRPITKLISDTKQSLINPKDIITVAKDNLAFIQTASKLTKPLTNELARASFKSARNFEKLIIQTPKTKLPDNIEPLSSFWNSELEEAIATTMNTKKASSLSKWKSKYLVKDSSDQYIAEGEHLNKRLIDFSELMNKYQSILKQSNLYDFDDMIQMSIDAIKKNDELRFNLQEKYQYIMLDEYQDTNIAQAELVYLLTNNPASEGRPNIMAVGDDDQAIYAFQGAKHSNMLDFTKAYKDVKLITLKTNYRSTQDIINLSALTADQIKSRITKLLATVSKDFKSASDSNGQITNLKFTNETEQYSYLSTVLKSGYKNQRIGIIAPEHKYLERASAYLMAEDIPINYERRENILEDKSINQIITILRLLKAINEQDSRLCDVLFAIVLNYDFFELSTETVWQLSWRARDKNQPWLKLMLNQASTRKLALMFIKIAANALAYRYDFIIDQVIGLSDVVINDPKRLILRSPFMQFYTNKSDGFSAELFSNLTTLKEQFTDFNGDNMKPLMISDLIDFINQLNSSDVRLVNNLNIGQTKANIELMSAHGAKGLEFDEVYLISFVNEVWGPKTSRKRISLPDNLEYIRQAAEDTDDEILRLLYVALTRAKHKLTTLSYDFDLSSKPTTPVKYLAISPEQVDSKIKPTMPLWQLEDQLTDIGPGLKELLKKRLESYALSATELNTFIDVRNSGPKAFLNSVLLKYRAPVSAKVDYGTAIHNSLEWLQRTFRTSGQLPSLKELLNIFDTMLQKRRLTPEDFIRLKEQGLNALSLYYSQNKNKLSKEDYSEYNFNREGIVIGGQRITGKIDKILVNKDSKTIEIVDYKTGKGSKSWNSQPKLYLYKKQLYFYKLLAEKSPTFKGYRVKRAHLEFIQPDNINKPVYELALKYDEQEQKRLTKLIKAVSKHLEELDFPSIASYSPNTDGIIQFEEDLISGKI